MSCARKNARRLKRMRRHGVEITGDYLISGRQLADLGLDESSPGIERIGPSLFRMDPSAQLRMFPRGRWRYVRVGSQA